MAMIKPLKSGGVLSLVVRNWFAEPYRIDVDAHTSEELPALLERTRGPSRVFDADILFFSTGFLQNWLQKQGFELLGDFGLLCRHDDFLDTPATGTEEYLLDKLHALESTMGEREPYKRTARYLQIIARKQ